MGKIIVRILRVVLALLGLIGINIGLLLYLRRRINKTAKPYTASPQCSDGSDEDNKADQGIIKIQLNSEDKIVSLEEGLLAVRYDGDYRFDEFLRQGGASSDKELIRFLTRQLKMDTSDLQIETKGFGCSTIAVPGSEGEMFFGRNFDWYPCNALIVEAHPRTDYASISTVNMDFIHVGTRLKSLFMSDDMVSRTALFLPLDGMNEIGLCVSVNMIQDQTTIQQHSGKPDITTTTAVRLLLDKAANVEEAVDLLSRYDLHASLNFMIHFAISDAEGNSVAVEYVNNEMIVTDTPVLTNFYLEKAKYGIGTSQSMHRYRLLMDVLSSKQTMTACQVRDTLNSVSKHNYHDGETTEWSIVFDKTAKTATYYHKEKYQKGFKLSLDD
ncbi:MAG: C45 family peptidase [bacterium]|nr:C45 family peptidase [bacterium]